MNQNNFIVLHEQLGHPRFIMILKIVEKSCGHPYKSKGVKVDCGPLPAHQNGMGRVEIFNPLAHFGLPYLVCKIGELAYP